MASVKHVLCKNEMGEQPKKTLLQGFYEPSTQLLVHLPREMDLIGKKVRPLVPSDK